MVPCFHYILSSMSQFVLGRVAAMLIHTLEVSQIGVMSRGDYHDHATLFQMIGAFLHIAQE